MTEPAKKEKSKKASKKQPYDQRKFIEKTLRGAFKKTPMYHLAKARAKEEFTVLSKHDKPMRRVHFRCAKCGKFFLDKTGAKEIAVDHIDPVVDPKTGWVDYQTYITRLFCSIDNLQILCNFPKLRDGVRSCHKIKTSEENSARAKNVSDSKRTD